MDTVLKARIEEWTKPPFDKDTIAEVRALVDKGDERELTDRFHATLEFGTGGLRGIIGAGTNRMNIYTVGIATQGLADYIVARGRASDGVVIARDSRKMSLEFARAAAGILAANGIKVYYFDDITPTPLCSFTIREKRAASGIVITASHNPPEYNGYKVYWDDGGQVVSPQDGEIIAQVNRVESISSIKSIPFDEGVASGKIVVMGEGPVSDYTARLEKRVFRKAAPSGVKIVYTPLHGTGYRIVPRVLAHFGFTAVSLVEEQAKPDGAFPTVKYPNPEERDALELSLALARKIDADLVLATDPDADRMGVGFKGAHGDYVLINGNQIGTMLEYYILTRMKENGSLPKNGAVVKTVVTTDLQDEIARSFGCEADNVLTGFKWIALKMAEYEKSGARSFVFGGEESYGYLPVDFVRDKDAVSSCYFFAEMADWLSRGGRTLAGMLAEIYSRYGLYLEDLHSLTLKGLDGMDRIKKIMSSFRGNPPVEFAAARVVRIDDLKLLERIDAERGTREHITGLPPSDVLQFFLTDGSKVTMRPSGTEPKIKFYFSVRGGRGLPDPGAAESALRARISALKKDLLARVEKV
ncbi:MAG: phospho-sugar mutase [Spirochaetes bacterium]|nr:MAG: phospho-sugar mutase [Spirochaetota bacterium]